MPGKSDSAEGGRIDEHESNKSAEDGDDDFVIVGDLADALSGVNGTSGAVDAQDNSDTVIVDNPVYALSGDNDTSDAVDAQDNSADLGASKSVGSSFVSGLVSRLPFSIRATSERSISQEESDLLLALALQQEENASVLEYQKKKVDQIAQAHERRTLRSNIYTRLASVRKRDHGVLVVPAEYSMDYSLAKSDGEYWTRVGKAVSPSKKSAAEEEDEEAKNASGLTKLEQIIAETLSINKLFNDEAEAKRAQCHRTGRCNYHVQKPKKWNSILRGLNLTQCSTPVPDDLVFVE